MSREDGKTAETDARPGVWILWRWDRHEGDYCGFVGAYIDEDAADIAMETKRSEYSDGDLLVGFEPLQGASVSASVSSVGTPT